MRSRRGAGRDGDGAVASRSAACVSDHRASSPQWSDQAGRRCVARGSRQIVGEMSRRGSGERRIPRGARGETEGDFDIPRGLCETGPTAPAGEHGSARGRDRTHNRPMTGRRLSHEKVVHSLVFLLVVGVGLVMRLWKVMEDIAIKMMLGVSNSSLNNIYYGNSNCPIKNDRKIFSNNIPIAALQLPLTTHACQ